MIYKVSAVVLAVALCIVPVFASDVQEDLNYLCEEHNCLAVDGVPDAVCSVCFFSGTSPDQASVDEASPAIRSVSRAVPNDDLFFGIKDPSRGKSYDQSNYVNGFDLLETGALVYAVSGEEGDFDDIENIKSAFAYSPVRESYVAQPILNEYRFFYLWFYPVGASSSEEFVLYPFIFDSLTVNLQIRTTLNDGTYCAPNGARLFYSMAVKRYDSVLGNSYWMYSTDPDGIGHGKGRIDLESLNGYENIWLNYPIDSEVWDSSYSTTTPYLGTFCSLSDENGSTPGAAQFKFSFPQGIQMIEIKKLDLYPASYDIVNGVFPDAVPDGGQIVGSTWPLMEDLWIEQQFDDAVNSELSGTATSVDDNIDTIQGFESQVHMDLNRYMDESGIADFSIPSDLGQAFTWVSGKFTSFIDAYPDLKVIVLFPVYLGLVVAIVHGLEFAGRSVAHKSSKGGGSGG